MHSLAQRRTQLLITAALALTCGLASATAQTTPQHYKQTDLTSSNASLAPVSDVHLINPWGLSRSSGGPWWVSDNGTGLSTLYSGTGSVIPLVVTIPPADAKKNPTGSPTGTVFNGGVGFPVKGNPSIFLFVTEDGTISGWSPKSDPTNAIIAVNEKDHASFKGATQATVNLKQSAQKLLYVADFFNAKVQVFDQGFHHLSFIEDRFQQPGEGEEGQSSSEGSDGFAPFNIQNIGGDLYVSYAKQDGTRLNEVDGPGLGYVVVYSPEGRMLRRLERGSFFNAPWGMALASGDFGQYSHDLLVGQFGSGEILVFDPLTGKFLGKLNDPNNAPLKIDGLWGLSFGNGLAAGPATSLYFSAGINHEAAGLFGSIAAVENAQGNDQ